MEIKAVLPVAGKGTRLLPASKAIPKELVPVIDKPVIQYVVQEAIDAGVRHLVFVTHPSKQAIEAHFAPDPQLEAMLAARSKQALLDAVREVSPAGVRFSYVMQQEPLGLGHAVLCAREQIGEAPFMVLLPDVLVRPEGSQESDLRRMLQRYRATGNAQILVDQVPPDEVDRYGIADTSGVDLEPGQGAPIRGLVEKPPVAQAPSRLAVVGRYLLPSAIFPLLASTPPGVGGEIQLTDAIAALLTRQSVDACCMTGRSFDCGYPMGYLQAIVALSLQDSRLGEEAARMMRAELARLAS